MDPRLSKAYWAGFSPRGEPRSRRVQKPAAAGGAETGGPAHDPPTARPPPGVRSWRAAAADTGAGAELLGGTRPDGRPGSLARSLPPRRGTGGGQAPESGRGRSSEVGAGETGRLRGPLRRPPGSPCTAQPGRGPVVPRGAGGGCAGGRV